MGLTLDKWYLDVVTDAGDAAIGYAATLRVSRLLPRLKYAAVLQCRGGEVKARSTARPKRMPRRFGRSVVWVEPRLGVHGGWSPLLDVEGVAEVLYDGPAGRVEWQCLHPASRVTFGLPDGPLFGVGYVEHLRLTLPPWRLPIDELRWGRAWVNRTAYVWIDWRGPTPLTRLWRDGLRVDGTVSDDAVMIGDARLTLTRHATLRDGPLADVLSTVPLVKRFAPRRVTAAIETKWISRATLGSHEGWAIHEVVRFPA